jgi:DNA polymerase-3 subunit alpha
VATHEIAQLNAEITGTVRVAGLLNQVKRMVTKAKGEQWASGELEDLSGEIRLLVFPRAYASGLSQKLTLGETIVASGRLSFREDGAQAAPEMIVEDITPVDVALMRLGKRLRLFAGEAHMEDDCLEKLRGILEEHMGNCPVVLECRAPEGTAELELEHRVRLDANLLSKLEGLLGEKSWRIESN